MSDNASSSSTQSINEKRSSKNDAGKTQQLFTEDQKVVTSTPEVEGEHFLNDDLKARLERILASPIRQPESYQFHMVKTTKAVVHRDRQEDDEIGDIIKEDIIRPVPLPRKRVMFEQPMTINENP